MKPKHQEMYMRIAETVAEQSYAVRLKVGAVAVKDDRIISIGYNGTASGDSNECEHLLSTGELKTRPEVIHAEQNTLYKMARDGESGRGADLFVTHAPCFECAKGIHMVGFSRVFFRNQYRSVDGVEYLQNKGIEVVQL